MPSTFCLSLRVFRQSGGFQARAGHAAELIPYIESAKGGLSDSLMRRTANLRKLLGTAATRDEDLYWIMIQSIEPERSFFQTFWAPASHPGQAIDSVLRACVHLGINNPIAIELECVDPSSVSDQVFHEQKSNVYYAQGRTFFPTEKTFIAPLGIIAGSERGKHDYDQIREGFSLLKPYDNIYELEAVIERDSLLNTFFDLVKRLPSIKVSWIRIAADWEDRGREQLWTNEGLNTIDSITNYLTINFRDTVANGHVAFTVYSDVGQTNLSIDTHKTIVVLTKSAKMQQRMAAGFRRLGFPELSKFYSLRYNYHHWHYRPTRSKSRTRLVAALKRSGFTLWKEHEPEVEE